jgi:hypothetical protein
MRRRPARACLPIRTVSCRGWPRAAPGSPPARRANPLGARWSWPNIKGVTRVRIHPKESQQIAPTPAAAPARAAVAARVERDAPPS